MDCMVGMAQFPDKFFELAIVDPPYGIGLAGYSTSPKTIFGKKVPSKGSAFTVKSWDKAKPDVIYFQELMRVSQNQIIWGGNYFADNLPPSKGWVYWRKHTNGQFADGELAWTSFDTPLREFDFVWNGLMQQDMKNKEQRIHPTQKPIALYRWLLQHYAKPGDKVLDTHVGSASSLIACHENGFQYVGFELDPDYYRAAKERLDKARAQVSIFDAQTKARAEQLTMIGGDDRA